LRIWSVRTPLNVVSGALVLLIAATAIAQVFYKNKQPNLFYYAGSYGLTPTPVRSAKYYAEQVFTNTVLTTWGGILFQSTAELNKYLAWSKLKLSYDQTQNDGSRLVLFVDGKSTRVPLYDWELIPILNFVASGDTGVVTLLDDPNPQEIDFAITKQLDGERVFFAAIQPALKDTLVGINTVFVDSMFLGPPPDNESLKERVKSYGRQLRVTDPKDQNKGILIEGYNTFPVGVEQKSREGAPKQRGRAAERVVGFDGRQRSDYLRQLTTSRQMLIMSYKLSVSFM
jgi:hypothetical protein